MDPHILDIYTDGSCKHHPRRGGMGIRFVWIDPETGNEITRDYEPQGVKQATNNEMELRASIEALEEAERVGMIDDTDKIIIHTDSRYVCDNVYYAKFIWPKNRWLRTTGQPVLNVELWKHLLRIIRRTRPRIEWRWLKGHQKNIHNEAVHDIATDSANDLLRPAPTPIQVRRKLSPKSTKAGSVKMRGQRVNIRIIDAEFLRPQRFYRYRYEVMSKGSRYLQNVDIICSDICLRAGHTYQVVFNRNDKNPWIVRSVQEVPQNPSAETVVAAISTGNVEQATPVINQSDT